MNPSATTSRGYLLLAAIFALAAWHICQTPSGGASTDSDRAYHDKVQSLIDDGVFQLAPDGGSIVVAANMGDRAEGIAYLDGDMKDLRVWNIVNGRVVGNTAVHTVSGPFKAKGNWTGMLSYARTAENGSGWIPLQPLRGPAPLIRLITATEFNLEREGQGTLVDIGRPAALDPIIAARLSCPVNPREALNNLDWAAQVYRVGDLVLVRANTASPCRVEVGKRALGHECPADGRDRCAMAALALGETLTVRKGHNVLVSYRVRRVEGEGGGALIDRSNDGQVNYPDEMIRPFAELMHRDLSLAMKDGCTDTPLTIGCADPIELALDRQIEKDADRAAAAHFLTDAPSFVAVTVMDTLTGDVLAMAGRTGTPGAEAGRKPRCPFAPLCTRPIGSSAKPIFATAILAAEPALRDLRIRPVVHGDRSYILGFPVGRLGNENRFATSDGSVDLPLFMAHSDNHYAAALILLASRTGPVRCRVDRFGSYYLGGRWNNERLKSPLEDDRCTPFRRNAARPPFEPRWQNALALAFDVNPNSTNDLSEGTYMRPDWFGDDLHDARVWQGLIRDVSGARKRTMLESSPDRESFNVSSMTSFREQLVPLTLGNGDGKWSTVKLAEAYSRIATGRRIMASYRHHERVEDPVGANDFGSARIAVSRGMAQVLLGTAMQTDMVGAVRELQSKLAKRNMVLGVFSKTGTMALPAEMARPCLDSGRRMKDCVGKAFVVVLAVYDGNAPNLVLDRFGRAADAAPVARCAVTIAVNFPQWNGRGSSNAAADAAAMIVRGAISDRFTSREPGSSCAG